MIMYNLQGEIDMCSLYQSQSNPKHLDERAIVQLILRRSFIKRLKSSVIVFMQQHFVNEAYWQFSSYKSDATFCHDMSCGIFHLIEHKRQNKQIL